MLLKDIVKEVSERPELINPEGSYRNLNDGLTRSNGMLQIFSNMIRSYRNHAIKEQSSQLTMEHNGEIVADFSKLLLTKNGNSTILFNPNDFVGAVAVYVNNVNKYVDYAKNNQLDISRFFSGHKMDVIEEYSDLIASNERIPSSLMANLVAYMAEDMARERIGDNIQKTIFPSLKEEERDPSLVTTGLEMKGFNNLYNNFMNNKSTTLRTLNKKISEIVNDRIINLTENQDFRAEFSNNTAKYVRIDKSGKPLNKLSRIKQGVDSYIVDLGANRGNYSIKSNGSLVKEMAIVDGKIKDFTEKNGEYYIDGQATPAEMFRIVSIVKDADSIEVTTNNASNANDILRSVKIGEVLRDGTVKEGMNVSFNNSIGFVNKNSEFLKEMDNAFENTANTPCFYTLDATDEAKLNVSTFKKDNSNDRVYFDLTVGTLYRLLNGRTGLFADVVPMVDNTPEVSLNRNLDDSEVEGFEKDVKNYILKTNPLYNMNNFNVPAYIGINLQEEIEINDDDRISVISGEADKKNQVGVVNDNEVLFKAAGFAEQFILDQIDSNYSIDKISRKSNTGKTDINEIVRIIGGIDELIVPGSELDLAEVMNSDRIKNVIQPSYDTEVIKDFIEENNVRTKDYIDERLREVENYLTSVGESKGVVSAITQKIKGLMYLKAIRSVTEIMPGNTKIPKMVGLGPMFDEYVNIQNIDSDFKGIIPDSKIEMVNGRREEIIRLDKIREEVANKYDQIADNVGPKGPTAKEQKEMDAYNAEFTRQTDVVLHTWGDLYMDMLDAKESINEFSDLKQNPLTIIERSLPNNTGIDEMINNIGYGISAFITKIKMAQYVKAGNESDMVLNDIKNEISKFINGGNRDTESETQLFALMEKCKQENNVETMSALYKEYLDVFTQLDEWINSIKTKDTLSFSINDDMYENYDMSTCPNMFLQVTGIKRDGLVHLYSGGAGIGKTYMIDQISRLTDGVPLLMTYENTDMTAPLEGKTSNPNLSDGKRFFQLNENVMNMHRGYNTIKVSDESALSIISVLADPDSRDQSKDTQTTLVNKLQGTDSYAVQEVAGVRVDLRVNGTGAIANTVTGMDRVSSQIAQRLNSETVTGGSKFTDKESILNMINGNLIKDSVKSTNSMTSGLYVSDAISNNKKEFLKILRNVKNDDKKEEIYNDFVSFLRDMESEGVLDLCGIYANSSSADSKNQLEVKRKNFNVMLELKYELEKQRGLHVGDKGELERVNRIDEAIKSIVADKGYLSTKAMDFINVELLRPVYEDNIKINMFNDKGNGDIEDNMSEIEKIRVVLEKTNVNNSDIYASVAKEIAKITLNPDNIGSRIDKLNSMNHLYKSGDSLMVKAVNDLAENDAQKESIGNFLENLPMQYQRDIDVVKSRVEYADTKLKEVFRVNPNEYYLNMAMKSVARSVSDNKSVSNIDKFIDLYKDDQSSFMKRVDLVASYISSLNSISNSNLIKKRTKDGDLSYVDSENPIITYRILDKMAKFMAEKPNAYLPHAQIDNKESLEYLAEFMRNTMNIQLSGKIEPELKKLFLRGLSGLVDGYNESVKLENSDYMLNATMFKGDEKKKSVISSLNI